MEDKKQPEQIVKPPFITFTMSADGERWSFESNIPEGLVKWVVMKFASEFRKEIV